MAGHVYTEKGYGIYLPLSLNIMREIADYNIILEFPFRRYVSFLWSVFLQPCSCFPSVKTKIGEEGNVGRETGVLRDYSPNRHRNAVIKLINSVLCFGIMRRMFAFTLP